MNYFNDIKHVKEISETDIFKILEQNPDFRNLRETDNGANQCSYDINGFIVLVFNEPGGIIKTCVGYDFPVSDVNSLNIADEFARRIQEILNR
jgi:hypothetical protein